MLSLVVAALSNNGSVFGGQGTLFIPGQLAFSLQTLQDTYAATQSVNLTVPPEGFLTPIFSSDADSNCSVTVHVFGVETASSP